MSEIIGNPMWISMMEPDAIPSAPHSSLVEAQLISLGGSSRCSSLARP